MSRRVFNNNNHPPLGWTEWSAGQKASANDENPAGGFDLHGPGGSVPGETRFHICWIFPELREIDGYFQSHGQGVDVIPSTSVLEWSADTTNGIDGTWSTGFASYQIKSDDLDRYRTGITSLAGTEQRALRYHIQANDNQARRNVRRAHIYGEISPGHTPDRLLFIDDDTGQEFTASFDYGDVPRGSSDDELQWRIKNNSATLQATTIQYTAESLFRNSGNWYTHTLPGGATFQSTRQVASLAADTTTALIKTRRITPGGEDLGPHAARIVLAHASFS